MPAVIVRSVLQLNSIIYIIIYIAGIWNEGLSMVYEQTQLCVYTYNYIYVYIYILFKELKHDSQVTGIWINYKNGVCNVTNYVSYHFGGDIYNVNGSRQSNQPGIYIIDYLQLVQHFQTYKMLESMMIANFDIKNTKVCSCCIRRSIGNLNLNLTIQLIIAQTKSHSIVSPNININGLFLTHNDNIIILYLQ